ncbi:PaaI family thioesterase [Rhodovulum sulfidophilum]|uniref:PaaI family thioesterase n=1 Tax=Rhodovulum sulfidophilum TaxID=35806 RepID=UPI0019222FD0|nr:PaaI family thioesterase [Rhodovulum sulfidophilum]MBL3596992.1 PaaI family thioesterase [Rhodovulum sulfidophilum]
MTDEPRATDRNATPADDRIAEIAAAQPPFARLLGLRLVSAAPERVVADLVVTEDLTNRNGTLHGGAIMAVADNLGGTATFLNIDLEAGEGTSTIESKTNFFRTVALGDTARCETVPLHRGRSTMVWQTTITRGDGTLAANVIQTQMVLRPRG